MFDVDETPVDSFIALSRQQECKEHGVELDAAEVQALVGDRVLAVRREQRLVDHLQAMIDLFGPAAGLSVELDAWLVRADELIRESEDAHSYPRLLCPRKEKK
uniref:Uncharacterized protein n=1 Tax=viral metagenome TaxID=1070528 RepID=A0A6H1ZIT3_9ZZZZ